MCNASNSDAPFQEQDLEQMIRLAGDGVTVSEDLRPRVLETAQTASAASHLKRFVVFYSLMLLLSYHWAHAPEGANGMEGAVGVTPQQLFDRAAQYSEWDRDGMAWGLVRAWQDCRRIPSPHDTDTNAADF